MVVTAGTPSPQLRVRPAVYRSEMGRARKINEDGVLCLNKVPLYAVADGTGGTEPARVALHALKNEAAGLAEKNALVAARADATGRLGVGRFLEGLFARANTAVFEAAEQIHERRIATTLCAATIVGEHAFIAHVGNSRAYLLRQGALRRLTDDHTLAALQLRRGAGGEQGASRLQSQLAQALGMSRALDVDLLELHLAAGDLLLITSDGVNRALTDGEIGACLMAESDPDARADLLLEKVTQAGAPDDTSFIILELEGPRRSGVEDLEAVARSSFLFSKFSDTEWHQLQPYLERVDPGAGETLCRTGDDAFGFGVVLKGRLEWEHTGREIRQLGQGQHFGALALAADGASAETVRALEPSALYVLTRPRYFEVQRLKPELGGRLTLALLESLGDRLGVLTTRLGLILDAANGKL